jgi:hypothetical protein
MKASQFDMAESCREAFVIFAGGGNDEKWAALKERATKAMVACDRDSERERAYYEALLLFLCGVDDLERDDRSESDDKRTRRFMHATRKLSSARLHFENAASDGPSNWPSEPDAAP